MFFLRAKKKSCTNKKRGKKIEISCLESEYYFHVQLIDGKMANCLADVPCSLYGNAERTNENRMPDLPNQTKIKIDCETFACV